MSPWGSLWRPSEKGVGAKWGLHFGPQASEKAEKMFVVAPLQGASEIRYHMVSGYQGLGSGNKDMDSTNMQCLSPPVSGRCQENLPTSTRKNITTETCKGTGVRAGQRSARCTVMFLPTLWERSRYEKVSRKSGLKLKQLFDLKLSCFEVKAFKR